MSARKGWIGEPQPQRDHKPSHALKWYKMMGAAEHLPPTPLPLKSSSPHMSRQRR